MKNILFILARILENTFYKERMYFLSTNTSLFIAT